MAIRPFPPFVDLSHISVESDLALDLRYSITIPFLSHENIEAKKCVVIMKNPSAAMVDHRDRAYDSDTTVNRVITYFHKKNYCQVTIINLFAKFDTESSELNNYIHNPIEIIGPNNDTFIMEAISRLTSEDDIIVVAWGGYPQESDDSMKSIYNSRITEVEGMLSGRTVYYVGRMVENNTFPLHGMIWSYDHSIHIYRF